MSDIVEWADQEAVKAELRKANQTISRMREEKMLLESAIVRAAKASFATINPPPVPAPKKDSRRKDEEVAVVLAADWQLGKVTPDYDSEVCEQRIRRFADKVIGLADIQRSDHPVKQCRLWLLGDIVEGETIFPGQTFHIDSPLIDQIITNGARITRDLIHRLLEAFETVHVVGVIGNHGRIGGLKSSPYHPATNADRMLYMVVREWFDASGEKRVTWQIPQEHRGDRGWYAVDTIGNYSSLLVHGDQVRGGASYGGLPYYGFHKAAMAWRDMSISGEMPAFRDVAMGHWHRNTKVPIGSMDLRIAGSPESNNPWSIETLKVTAPPSQHLMFVHPGRGMVTAEYRVHLEG